VANEKYINKGLLDKHTHFYECMHTTLFVARTHAHTLFVAQMFIGVKKNKYLSLHKKTTIMRFIASV
jgi:hypothetical protein